MRHALAEGENAGWTKQHNEDNRQEESNHRHGQLRRQCGGLLFGHGHAVIAVFLGKHAQCDTCLLYTSDAADDRT